MSELSAIAEAVTALCDIYLAHLNPSQQTRINTAYNDARSDMQSFCQALLRGDVGTCNLLINGLRSAGPLPELTPGEITHLERVIPGIDGATLANLYCRAREGDFATRVNQIAAPSGGNTATPIVSGAAK